MLHLQKEHLRLHLHMLMSFFILTEEGISKQAIHTLKFLVVQRQAEYLLSLLLRN